MISKLIIFIGFLCLTSNKELERLTFEQTYDKDNTYFLINAEDNYKEINKLIKDEYIIHSGTYSYKWERQDINKSLYLMPIKTGSDIYTDMSNYDSIYLNIYSKYKTQSEFIIIINCQERNPDYVTSFVKYCYASYKIRINFVGWKQFKIRLNAFSTMYEPDFSRVSSIQLGAEGWEMVPNNKTILYFDKILITKATYNFNIKEENIKEEYYSTILDRLKYTFTYSLLDSSNTKIVTNRINAFVNDAKNQNSKINKEGNPFGLSLSESSHMTTIYSNIRTIAIGYACEGSEIYKNSEILNNILYLLDWTHNNYFSKRENITFTGFNNWWDWQIGSPQRLLEILTIIRDSLTQEQINKYIEPIERYVPFPSLTMCGRFNTAYSCIFSGAFKKDYIKIATAIESFRECFELVEINDGFYEDGSFIQHGYYPYQGGYGAEMLTAMSRISYSLENTIFNLDEEIKNGQYNWVINSFLPVMYNGVYFDLVRGRTISRDGKSKGTGISTMDSLSLMVEYFTNDNHIKYLKGFLKRLYLSSDYSNYYIYNLQIHTLITLEKIKSDETITEEYTHNFAKVFSYSDKSILQYNNIGIGISMSSSRNGKYESINWENTKGWYSGDGMVYIYLSVNDYGSDYWKNVNIIRLGGTTITTAERIQKTWSGLNSLTPYNFVGGAYFGTNMVNIMEFGSASPSIGFESTLKGKKSYFSFNEILICIGREIYCQDEENVETIIENKKISGKFYFGNQVITDTSGNLNNNFIYIEDYGGIYIPNFSKVKFNLSDKNFLEIYFSHGKKFNNENYLYMIFPKIKQEEIETYKNYFDILSNNDNAIAIKDKRTNITEYVFLKSGQVGDLKVDNPCTLIKNGKDIYISDPTHLLNYITVSIGSDNYIIRVYKGLTSSYTIK